MVGLLKQVIRKRHCLFVNLVFELGLLGDAPEIEVRNGRVACFDGPHKIGRSEAFPFLDKMLNWTPPR